MLIFVEFSTFVLLSALGPSILCQKISNVPATSEPKVIRMMRRKSKKSPNKSRVVFDILLYLAQDVMKGTERMRNIYIRYAKNRVNYLFDDGKSQKIVTAQITYRDRLKNGKGIKPIAIFTNNK